MKTVELTRESAKEYAGSIRALARMVGKNHRAVTDWIDVGSWHLVLDPSNNPVAVMKYPFFHMIEGYEEPEIYIKNKRKYIKVDK